MLSHPSASQPWDRPGWRPADVDDAASIIERKRESVLAETLGHYPAPLAILDCVGEGLPQPFDAAIRTEMQIFSKLIQRREPRNMIRTLFLGRLDHDRLRKAGGIPAPVEQAVAAVSETLQADGTADATLATAFARAGFCGPQALRRRSMVSLRSPRSGWRRSLSPRASVRCANGWRGRMPWQTNGGAHSPRNSVARRIICWSRNTAFPPIWQAPSPPLSPAPE